MLLDPAEQEFDLPSALVEGCNLNCRAFEIVGDESDRPAFVTFDLDASQWDRQTGIALAGERYIGIGDDLEPIATGLAHVAMLCRAQARVGFDPRNQESLGGVDLLPPAKVIIAFVENVGGAGFEFGLTADLDVVDGRIRNLDATRTVVVRLIDDVQLHAANASIPGGPFTHLPQRDRTRINQPHHLAAFCPRAAVGLLRQHREGIGENIDRTPAIGIRQRRASNLADAEMVMLMRVGAEGKFEPAQACDAPQLRTHQRYHVIPAFERFVVGIPLMAIHNRAKSPLINRFEELSKDAMR